MRTALGFGAALVTLAACTSSPSASRPATTPVSPVVGPWDATLVAKTGFLRGDLATDGTYLYALGDSSVVRIDPRTGTSHTVPAPAEATQPAIANHELWLAAPGHAATRVTVQRYTLPDLRPLLPITLTLGSTAILGPAITTSTDQQQVYVGAGTSVVALRASNATPTRRFTVRGGVVAALAALPGGSVLAVGTNPGGGAQGTITEFATSNGRLLSSHLGALGLGGVTASQGGLWEIANGGHTSYATFEPGGRIVANVAVPPSGGGGLVPTVTITGQTVWVGGTQLSCANPETGKTLATASLFDNSDVQEASIAGVVNSDAGGYFGIYTNTQTQLSGVVRFSPPAVCSE